MTAIKVRKEERSNGERERKPGGTICREQRFCLSIPCIPARPRYRRCKERLCFGADYDAQRRRILSAVRTFSIATIKLYALKDCSELLVLQISSMATSRMCVSILNKHPTALSGDYQPR